jgi:hypothetical protein
MSSSGVHWKITNSDPFSPVSVVTARQYFVPHDLLPKCNLYFGKKNFPNILARVPNS